MEAKEMIIKDLLKMQEKTAKSTSTKVTVRSLVVRKSSAG